MTSKPEDLEDDPRIRFVSFEELRRNPVPLHPDCKARVALPDGSLVPLNKPDAGEKAA